MARKRVLFNGCTSLFLLCSSPTLAGGNVTISDEVAGYMEKAKNAVEGGLISLETHNVHVSETEDEITLVFRPKDAPQKGRGNMSSTPAATVIIDRTSGEVRQTYFVR